MLDLISTALKPPRKLGNLGSSLWESLQREYVISDAAGIELLMQACEAADRIGRLSEQIDKDGEVIQSKSGPRIHPCVKEELACRGFIVRTLQALGLNLEPVRGRVGARTAWEKQEKQREGKSADD
jgi:hypothetical protein